MDGFVPGRPGPRLLRLETLVNLRWLAIGGQLLAILVVAVALGFSLPLPAALGFIFLSAALNLILHVRYPHNHRLADGPAAAVLSFDIVQLASLLFLTGGLENPFSLLFLAPVMISASGLPPSRTLALGLLAMLAATLLAFFHLPLPWHEGQTLRFPALYILGIWLAVMLGLAFIGVFAWRVAEEARQLGDALAATELVLAREQHMTQLDGLAAAAAHELGTPLATIALVAKEMDREIGPEDPLKGDVALLREQVDRCRHILGKITTLGTEPSGPMRVVGLRQLLEEVSAPQRPFDLTLSIDADGTGPEPRSLRSPGLIYGLENLIDNAVDYAATTVSIRAQWSEAIVIITIRDDGPGFAADVLRRLGEPFVTTRRLSERTRDAGSGGLGLGFFIAKTLLERSGARFSARNQAGDSRGAEILLRWDRDVFEAGVAPEPETKAGTTAMQEDVI